MIFKQFKCFSPHPKRVWFSSTLRLQPPPALRPEAIAWIQSFRFHLPSLSRLLIVKVSSASIRGVRYFGPSKMSFYNLIKHSLSIISVFKFSVLLRSILFSLVYIYVVSKNITYITLLPLILVAILFLSIFMFSFRENLENLKNSQKNIKNIETIK